MSIRQRQRGAAALFVTAMLCFAMVLAAALAHRNIVVEEQRSGNELRARSAFAAADAGLEWALARINDATAVGPTCLPSSDPAATSFRARMLHIDAISGAITAATWSDAGVATPLAAACVHGAAGWSCSCPASGRPTLPDSGGGDTAPAFFVELAPVARAGVVRAIATGCTRSDAHACAPTTAGGREATTRLEIAWALLPALRSAPVAALTAGGHVDLSTSMADVENRDPATGLAIHAGGRIFAGGLHIGAPAGASLASTIASDDNSIAVDPANDLFARHFGMGERAWTSQPAVHRIGCSDDCSRSVADAVAAGARLLAIDGDAAISGPLALGTRDDPIVLVVHGALRIHGDVAVHGIVRAGSIEWNGGDAGAAFVRGALVSAGDVRAIGSAATIVRDGDVLARLGHAAGSFVRVNGSWKDF